MMVTLARTMKTSVTGGSVWFSADGKALEAAVVPRGWAGRARCLVDRSFPARTPAESDLPVSRPSGSPVTTARAIHAGHPAPFQRPVLRIPPDLVVPDHLAPSHCDYGGPLWP